MTTTTSTPARPRRRTAVPWTAAAVLALILGASSILAACSTAGASPSPSPSPSATATDPPATVSPSPAAAFPITVTDDEGTAVEIAAEPQRIVTLTPATTEILFKLGAGPRVVATTDFDDYPPEAAGITQVGGAEAIVPAISGRAWITGTHQFVLDPGDPFPEGFRLSDTWGAGL